LLAEPGLRADMGRRAVAKAAGYTWGFAAARLRRLYVDLAVRELVVCP
jgi:hypothetical protein